MSIRQAAIARRGRVSNLSPNQIAGLILWLAADSLALGDGAAVPSWADKSGSGNTVSQATGGSQPIFKTGIINGKPVVRFDGVDDTLARATGGLVGQVPHSLIVVARFNAVAHYQIGVALGTGATTSALGVTDAGQTFVGGAADGNAAAGDSDHRGAWHVYSKVAKNDGSGSSVVPFVDGTTLAASVPTAVVNIADVGMSVGVATANQILGDVAEILAYSQALSTFNRQSVERYLGAKYGIGVA